MGVASPRKVEDFMKKIKKYTNPRLLSIIHYIKLHRATIREFISYDLDIPHQSVCRYIKKLLKLGIIYISGEITRRGNKGVKGGPRPEILSFDPVQPEDIARCRSRYYKECNAGIGKAREITQLVIEEYVNDLNEIKYSDIFTKVKQEAVGFDPLPISDEVAFNLHKLEVKVWR